MVTYDFHIYYNHRLCSCVSSKYDTHIWCSYMIKWLPGCQGGTFFLWHIHTWYMISYVNFTNIHIWCFWMWCSHVIFTYEFLYMNIRIWYSYVKIVMWYRMWSSPMFICDVFVCDVHMWCSYMNFCIWYSHVIMTYYTHMWYKHMIITCNNVTCMLSCFLGHLPRYFF